MTQAVQPPDVGQLKDQSLPTGQFPGGVSTFRVFIAPDAHKKMLAHADSDTGVEVCGVLVGDWRRDEHGPFVQVDDSISGEAAESKQAEVTFTHQTWTKINQEMDQKFQDKKIVGWYHTHPDFGVFLSDRDRFIHEHFFSAAGQIAYVIDPIRKDEGVFRWSRGEPVLCDFFWVGDRLVFKPEEEKPRAASGAALANATATATTMMAPAPEQPSTPRWIAEMAFKLLVVIGLFVLGYMLGSREGIYERARNTLGVANLKSLRPGLSEWLEAIERDMEAQGQDFAKLAEHHSRTVTDKSEADKVRLVWRDLLQASASSRAQLAILRQLYGLSHEETSLLKRMADERNQMIDQMGPRVGRTEPSHGDGGIATAPPATQPTSP